MIQTKTYYRHLGLCSNPTEVEVRAAYKALALQQHPDKAIDTDQEEATTVFQQLQEAYEFCLFCAQVQIQAEDDQDDFEDDVDGEDDSDWRGQLPDRLGGTGLLWEELTGNEPAPVRRWAEVSEKAVRNTPFLSSMSKAERDLLNQEYSVAYKRFEAWRQNNIERLDQEDKQQHAINSLPDRQAKNARVALEKVRSSTDYVYKTGYEDDVDEQACFDTPFGSGIPTKLTDTWRNNHNTKLKIAPLERLAQFQRQVAATELRGAMPDHTRSDERRRAKSRAASAAKLMTDATLAEQGYARKQGGELFLHQGSSRQQTASVNRLMEENDEPVDFQRSVVKRIAAPVVDEDAFWGT